MLSVVINGKKAHAIYDPGCVGVAVSKLFVAQHGWNPEENMVMTIFGAEGVSTLERGVFMKMKIKWEGTISTLPAVVLPLVSFDCLLGMSWIKDVGANLDIEKGCI